jgi:ABC-type transport system involved in multi-copper enzyme maturation permease subunit
MHPLVYTTPVSKTEYLGGRLLAAFVLNAIVLLGVQVGSLLAVYAPGIDPSIVGPFRPAAYVSAYVSIALPNAIIVTAVQFSLALKSGKWIAAYLGSLILAFGVPASLLVYFALHQPALAKMVDPIGMVAIMNAMMLDWTIVEKNVRMFFLEGPMLWNRLLWLSIATALLLVVRGRFRFAHRTQTDLWAVITRRFTRRSRVEEMPRALTALSVPEVRKSFGLATGMKQVFAIARSSFAMIAQSPAGIFLLAVFPAMMILIIRVQAEQWGVPLVPRTSFILPRYVMSPIAVASDYRVAVPLLIIYFAGELVWRERDARLNENLDVTPVREWVLLVGKFIGLALMLAALMVSLTIGGMIAQLSLGFSDFRIDHYATLLFGMQLPEYLLFAALVMVVHAVVNNKYAGMLAGLVAYFTIVFSPLLGLHHHLLVFGTSPDWTYTDIREFGRTLAPWVWFKLYWAAWALMLLVVARIFWMRGVNQTFPARLSVASQRFTRSTASAAGMALGLIVILGGFIFYNTNIRNVYRTDAELMKRQAAYERRYGRYDGIPQPQLAAAKLRVDIYPDRGEANASGSYRLVNRDSVPIDSLHIETPSTIETKLNFDRPAARVFADDDFSHSIYALTQPIAPGDSITLTFEVSVKPHGFRNTGRDTPIVPNGTHFTGEFLPLIGYQRSRELTSADDRRREGLPRKLTFTTPDDVDPDVSAEGGATFDAVVSTENGQVAVAPGELRRRWSERGRSYFHYASDIPIVGRWDFFSANYVIRHEKWNDVDMMFFHDPRDANNIDRLVKGARASLDYYSREFGPYPYRFLQFVEQPAKGLGMGVDGSGVVTVLERFLLMNPQKPGLDVLFEVTTHEMGHQWWGVQLKYARAEGAILLSESLAWYSGMQVVKATRGREGLRQFMAKMREPNPWPQIRTGLPLLRAMDPYAGYRKGPFAFYALSEYVGEARMNAALKTLIEKKTKPMPALATTLDLYRELEAATPDSMRSLLYDLFAVNTWWRFDTKKATAVQTSDGKWQVTFDIDAHKTRADSTGREHEVPIQELVELAVFAPAGAGEVLGKPLYLGRHHLEPGRQTITVTVSEKPARGGIDPYNLLDWDDGDNIEGIEIK